MNPNSTVNSVTAYGVVKYKAYWLPCVRLSADGGNNEYHVLDGAALNRQIPHDTVPEQAFHFVFQENGVSKNENLTRLFVGKVDYE